MSAPLHGEIWWGEHPNRTPRPYLVLTRDEAIPVLAKVLAAPITRRVRSIPTEIALGRAEGLQIDCVASMDNIAPIRKAFLVRRMGHLGSERRREICAALNAAIDC